MRKTLISARQQPDRLIFAAALLLLGACAPPPQDIQIEFQARLGAIPLRCEDGAGTALSDLRFFVAKPALLKADGSKTAIALTENGRWQQADLALIDVENGEDACQNGTADSNALLIGTVPSGDYRGLEFTLGVPFDRNHADPLAASVPLDDSTMHWHWRSGYKFLRAGIATADDGFWLHLGSSACQGTVQSITGCDNPNRVTITLSDFEPGQGVVVDLAPLLSVSDLEDATVTSCSSGPAESTCVAAFAVLGLAFSESETTREQQLFRVASP